ncbi:MAG: site-2 protease family protein [Coriobacteriia bacterium]|nr:site-2 protease family protein [Coriobacteriia bacterium]
MPQAVAIIFWGIILISIIVFIHEGGHFLTARLMGVRVREFMLGLPGPSLGIKGKQTRYGVTAIPLGGYCLVAGETGAENPNLSKAYAYLAYWGSLTTIQADKSSEALGFDLVEALDSLVSWMTIEATKLEAGNKRYDMPAATVKGVAYAQGQPRPVASHEAASAHIDEERKHTYAGMPWYRRMIFLLGGSAFNLIFGILITSIILMALGTVAATTTIDSVSEGLPAQKAGIIAGDTITSVDGTSFTEWAAFAELVSTHKAGDTIELGYTTRSGVKKTASITLVEQDGRALVGISPKLEPAPVSFIDALGTTFMVIGMTAELIANLLNPFTAGETISQSSSVVGIAVEAERAASSGFLPFIFLAGLLSISIGLMNLLPVPPLDGGKIVIETIQRVTGRTIPVAIVNSISIIALLLLLLLFIVLTNQDIHRYFLGG